MKRKPIKIRRVWLEEARSSKPDAKWRPIKDGIARLRHIRVMMTTEP